MNNQQTTKSTEDKIQWHPAFYAAAQLEFAEYKDKLEFIGQYQLTKKPLIIDVLIIKKHTDLNISKNLGKIFRSYNILDILFKTNTENIKRWNISETDLSHLKQPTTIFERVLSPQSIFNVCFYALLVCLVSMRGCF